MPQLRPMSTGEILDRTFSNYRHNFKLFAGIAAIPAAILLLLKLLIVLVGAANNWTAGSRIAGSAALTFTIVGSIVAFIFYMICLAISQGATAYAVSAVHLEIPTTIRESYARIKGRYGRMVNVILSVYIRVFGIIVISYLLIFSVAFMPATLGATGTVLSIVFGILAFVGMIVGLFIGVRLFARYSLAVPACVVEDIKARAAIKRSVFLSKGSVGKILSIYILVVIINMVAAFGIAIPIQMLLVVSKTTMWRTLITVFQEFGSFIVGTVVGPLATIALSLVYFDERVRKEAFDINYMLQFLPQAPTSEPPVATTLPGEIASTPVPMESPIAEPPVQFEGSQPVQEGIPEAGKAGTVNS